MYSTMVSPPFPWTRVSVNLWTKASASFLSTSKKCDCRYGSLEDSKQSRSRKWEENVKP